MVPVLLLCTLQPARESPDRLKESRIVARINDEIITAYEMEEIYKEARLGPEETELRKIELRKKAREILFLQEARRKNISVTKNEVDNAVAEDIRNFKDREAFLRWLERRGTSLARYEKEKRLQLIFQKLFSLKYQEWISEPGSRAPPIHVFVTPAEMEAYYRNHPEEFNVPERVSLLRLTLPCRTPEERREALRRLRSVLRRVREGTPFEYLARMYSPKHMKVAIPRLVRENTLFSREITNQIFDTLKVGELSGILEEPGALHLVQVVDKTEARKDDFEDAQPRIRTILEYQKRKRNEELLLKELLRDAYYWPPDLFE